MKKVIVILMVIALFGCEKENEFFEQIDESLNSNLTLIESEKDYSLTYILGYETNIDVNDITRIEVNYQINGLNKYVQRIDLIDDCKLNVSNEALIEQRCNPEQTEIIMYDEYDEILVSGIVPFRYSGDYNEDYVNKYYSEYPINFISPVTGIEIDNVYLLNEFTGSIKFDKSICAIKFEYFDENLNVTHTYHDRFNYTHQYPLVRFNVNQQEIDKYNISYVKFSFIHQLEEIDYPLVIAEKIYTIQ